MFSKEETYYKLLPDGNYVPVNPVQPKLTATPILAKPNILNPILISTEDWDGWPDGNLEQDFSWREFEETSNLSVHWAVRVNGGDHRGDEHAELWQKGKKSSRQCWESLNATILPATSSFDHSQHQTESTSSLISPATVVLCLNTESATSYCTYGAGQMAYIIPMVAFTYIEDPHTSSTSQTVKGKSLRKLSKPIQIQACFN